MKRFDDWLGAALRGALRRLARAVELRGSWPLLGVALLLPAAAGQIAPTAFVDGFEAVPDALLEQLGAALPSAPAADAAALHADLGAALTLASESEVSVVYLANTSERPHTLGYFTWSDAPLTIHDRQLVFPRADDQALQPGDSVTLRDANGAPRSFPAGTRLGFFLVAEGWKQEPQVKTWKAATATLPSLDPATNDAAGAGLFTTVDALNPEFPAGDAALARHAVLLALDAQPGFLGGELPLALAFEDRDRVKHSDHDFNDLVVLLRAKQPGALGGGVTPLGDADTDSDADGVPDTLDAYPHDPDRAAVQSVPGHGHNVLGLEDLYPAPGDADFNDAVLAYRVQLVSDAAGDLREILASFHLLARGGSRVHRLGLHLPGLPADAQGSLQVERFLEDAEQTHTLDEPVDLADFVQLHERRLETLLPNSHTAIEPLPGAVFVNTESATLERPAAAARVLFRFDPPLAPAQLGPPPWDLYWDVYDGARWVAVHQAGFAASDDHPLDLPPEQGADAFVDDEGYPWLLDVPFDFRFPVEHHSILSAYPLFREWAASKGTQHQDWAAHPAPGASLSLPAEAYLVTREWTLALPSPAPAP